MILSPSTATCTGTTFPFGRVSVHPAVSPVAVSPDSTALPPALSVVRSFHLPARLASESAAVLSEAAGAAGAMAAVVSRGGWTSDFLQPTRTAAQQKTARWRM